MAINEPANRFTLEMRMDATLSVKAGGELVNWIKPGASASMHWDNGVPTANQIEKASNYLARQIIEPILEEIVETSRQKLDAGL